MRKFVNGFTLHTSRVPSVCARVCVCDNGHIMGSVIELSLIITEVIADCMEGYKSKTYRISAIEVFNNYSIFSSTH